MKEVKASICLEKDLGSVGFMPQRHRQPDHVTVRLQETQSAAGPRFNQGRKSTRLAKSRADWAARASAFLKKKLRENGIAYVDLAKRLKRHGFAETEASITNKLKRGTFPATFFLACIAAMELDGVVLKEI
jgi:hypothetical protein